MDRDAELSEQLAPLRAAVLADAHAEAEAILSEAATRVANTEANAGRDRAAIEQGAREEGERAGTIEAARRRAAVARAQRREVLQARCDAYEHIRNEAIAAVLALRDEADYGELENRLAVLARNALGPDATIERDPDGLGGVRATAGSRTIDLTLPRLAEGCLGNLGEDIAEVLQ